MHNLQGIDVDIPLNRFTVVTGPSGSGKSSLAFDTLFREGQRRFLESMSTYARRFLGRMDRAPVDRLEGLGPAIAIDQRQSARSPRSTVATTTEIADYLRLLWARIGRPHCPRHGQELLAWSPGRIADQLLQQWQGQRGYLLAPIPVPAAVGRSVKKAALWEEALRDDWRKAGFARVMRDGEELRLDGDWPRAVPKELMLVVDRVTFTDRNRLSDSAEQAVRQAAEHGPAMVVAQRSNGAVPAERLVFSADKTCPHCGHQAPDQPPPRFFSFNHHSGACPSCAGLGEVVVCSPELLVNHPARGVFDGGISHGGAAFTFLTRHGGYYHAVAEQAAEVHGFDLDLPWRRLPAAAQHLLLRGCGDQRFEVVFKKRTAGKSRTWRMAVQWKGLARQVEEWFHGRDEGSGDERFRAVMRSQRCPDCDGERLQLAQRHVRVGGRRLPEVVAMTVDDALTAVAGLALDETEQTIGKDALRELQNRMGFLRDVGLGYLGLDRSATTLSGGEAQRIRLATQLGNQLVGVLYVLDEPTVGLHPRDTERLLRTLHGLRDLGNTVVAVEHDPQVIRSADHVLDLGPGAGQHGGRLVAAGTPEVVEQSDGLTGRWLRGDLFVPARRGPAVKGSHIALQGVAVHNLKDIDVKFPLRAFTVVTGVSGSGKSSLVMDALVQALEADDAPLRWLGGQQIGYRLVAVDQAPLGMTPASNAATYTGVFTAIRGLFAQTPAARQKGFKAGRFSFNVAEGRCPACEGKGQIQVEMHFLADVWVTCEICRGRRYNAETLTVEYRNRTIAQVLDMEVDEALEFFGNHRRIAQPMRLLHDVGLGYLRLGQAATTFSGGEAQRIKLVGELGGTPREHNIYVMDEPTTGLHMNDVGQLLAVLRRLLERGDTVIVIEHNLDVIRAADHVIELGPEAGDAGGRIIAEGTPVQLARGGTHTGRFLAQADSAGKGRRAKRPRRSRSGQEVG